MITVYRITTSYLGTRDSPAANSVEYLAANLVPAGLHAGCADINFRHCKSREMNHSRRDSEVREVHDARD